MKIVSWNINALRAHEQAFRCAIGDLQPDVFCLQEIRVRESQATFPVEGYYSYMNPGDEKGLYGTGVYIREGLHPLSITFDPPMPEYGHHGRIEALEFEPFFVVNSYWPFSMKNKTVDFLPYRLMWCEMFEKFMHKLQERKPVIICGDMNMVREPIDAHDGICVRRSGCFYPEEHACFEQFLQNEHLIDSFRHLHPDKQQFTSWAYSKEDTYRKNNQGFRIDYFLVSEKLIENVKSSQVLDKIKGSSNCPIMLEI